jgi:hypothetical protein
MALSLQGALRTFVCNRYALVDFTTVVAFTVCWQVCCHASAMTDTIRQFLAPRPQRRVLQLVMLRDPLNALVSLFHYQHMNQPLSHNIPTPRLAIKFFQKYAGSYLKYWAPYSYPGNVCDRCVREPHTALFDRYFILLSGAGGLT